MSFFFSKARYWISIELHKLKLFYSRQSTLDKVLDIVLLLGVLGSLSLFISELFVNDQNILHLIHTISFYVFLAFLFDLIRSFLKIRNFTYFLKSHWIDFVVLLISGIYYGIYFTAAFGRLSYIAKIVNLGKGLHIYHFKDLHSIFTSEGLLESFKK